MCDLFVSETVFLPMVRMTFSRNQIGLYKALTSSRWGGVILQWMKMDENLFQWINGGIWIEVDGDGKNAA